MKVAPYTTHNYVTAISAGGLYAGVCSTNTHEPNTKNVLQF